MTLQHFALKNDATGFTAAEAALLARGQAIYGPSFQLARRPTADDATVEIIDAALDSNDLVGDLGVIATAIETRMPSALVYDVFADAQDFRERGFPMLGEMARSEYPEMAGVRYIAQPGAVGGANNGKFPWTAFEGPETAAINGGTNRKLPGEYIHFLIGVVHKEEASSFNFAGRYVDFADASGGERSELRSDHPIFPGILLGTMTDRNAGLKGDPWVHEGGNIYSQADWGRNVSQFVPFQTFLVVTSAVDPTDSFTDILEKAFYKIGTSATTLNPGEWFLDAAKTKMYVRLVDDSAPPAGFNISTRWDNGGGHFLNFVNGGKNIRCTNLRTLACTQTNWGGATDLEVLGGQQLLNANLFLLSVSDAGWKWGAASYGRLTYDRTDIKDENDNVVAPTHPLVLRLIAEKGSAAAAWADMDMWACIWGQDNGLYQNNAVSSTLNWIDGALIVDTHGTIANSRGTIKTYAGGDGHAVATRGGLLRQNTVVRRFVSLRAGRHKDFYFAAEAEADAPYDFGGTKNAGNYIDNIVEDFLLLDDNGNGTGIAHGGMGVENDNDHVLYLSRTDGIKTGNIVRRFACGNLPNDAIICVSEQPVEYRDYIIDNCHTHYLMGRNFTESVPFAAVVTNGEATVTNVTENLLLGSGGDATQLNLVNTNDYLVMGFLDTPRRVEVFFGTGSVAAAGTYTLAVEKYTASGWVAVSSLTNGTNSLKQSGEITHARDGSEILADLYGQTQMAFLRIRLASGSFTTPPTITKLGGRRIGAPMFSRGATVTWGAKSQRWNRTNSGLYEVNSRYEDVDDFTLDLGDTLVAETAAVFNDGNSTFSGWKTVSSGFYKNHTEANSDVPKGKADNRGGNVTVDDIIDANS